MPVDPKKDYVQEDMRSIKSDIKDLTEAVSKQSVELTYHSEAVKEIKEDLKEIKNTNAKNTDSLERHMRRTELNEQMVVKLDAKLTELEIAEIGKKAVRKWLKNAAVLSAKIAGAVGALAASAAYVPGFIKFLIAYSDIIK